MLRFCSPQTANKPWIPNPRQIKVESSVSLLRGARTRFSFGATLARKCRQSNERAPAVASNSGSDMSLKFTKFVAGI